MEYIVSSNKFVKWEHSVVCLSLNPAVKTQNNLREKWKNDTDLVMCVCVFVAVSRATAENRTTFVFCANWVTHNAMHKVVDDVHRKTQISGDKEAKFLANFKEFRYLNEV